MSHDAVIVREILRQAAVPFLGVVEGPRVRSFPAQNLVKLPSFTMAEKVFSCLLAFPSHALSN